MTDTACARHACALTVALRVATDEHLAPFVTRTVAAERLLADTLDRPTLTRPGEALRADALYRSLCAEGARAARAWRLRLVSAGVA